MTRSPFAAALAVFIAGATAPGLFAQSAKPAAATTPAPAAAAPAARAKWMAPIKGVATIEVIRGNPKQVGNEVLTVLKVKNTSAAPIALLRADEYWYDKDRKMVTGDTQRHRQPLQPGEIVELTMRSPAKPNLVQSQVNFAHANGTIQAKGVKKF
jgi:hypothetical protein